MKKVLAILGIGLWCSHLYAQPSFHARADSHIYLHDNLLYHDRPNDSLFIIVGQFFTPVVFDVNKYAVRTTPQLDEAIDSITCRKNTLTQIWVKGSASPEGPSDWNRKLGQYRAEALANYLSQRTGLNRGQFRTYNLGEDWEMLAGILASDNTFPNRERILDILAAETDNETRKRKIRELDEGRTWRRLIEELFPPIRNARLAIVSVCPKFAPIVSEFTLRTPPIVPVESGDVLRPYPTSGSKRNVAKRSNWKIAAKTNLLFDAALVANLGVEITPWTHWSLDIPIWYSPYDLSATRKIRLLSVQPEIRWWPGEALSRHFIGLHTHIAGFNIAVNSHTRYQDPNHALWGLGLSYGYVIPFGKSGRWGLEFNIGAGFARYQYDAYRNWDNGPRFKSGSDCYWGITRVGVTLSYKWDLSRKGGEK